MAQHTTKDRDELKSLLRGLDLLLIFDELDQAECHVDLILGRLDAPRTTSYRLLRTLKSRGFLVEGSKRGYVRLGGQVSRLGELACAPWHLGAIARPVLERLARASGESAFVAVRAGNYYRYEEFVDSPEELRVTGHRGKRAHLHTSATGKVLLAFSPEREIRRFLAQPLPAYTPRTITDPARIEDELGRIRAEGYALSTNQTNLGSTGISVPVFDDRRVIAAALTLIGPEARIGDDSVPRHVGNLRTAAREIEAAMTRETAGAIR